MALTCFLVRGPALVVDHADETFHELFGDREPVGRPLLESFPELAIPDLAPTVRLIRDVMRTGERMTITLPSRMPRWRGRMVELTLRPCDHEPDAVAILYHVEGVSPRTRPGSCRYQVAPVPAEPLPEARPEEASARS